MKNLNFTNSCTINMNMNWNIYMYTIFITLEWKKSKFHQKVSIPITVPSELAKGFSIYSATYGKSPTIWWIKSHNSGMKNWNFTIKYKVRPSIPITLWNLKWIGQGVLKLERDMWNGRRDSRTLVYHNTSRLKDRRIKTEGRSGTHEV